MAPDPPVRAPAGFLWSPQGQLLCDEDFGRYSAWSDFESNAACDWNVGQLTNWGRNNVDVDGSGLFYRFRALPTQCGDQIVGQATLDTSASEVWLEFTGRFSDNWTNVNPNCSTPSPDYKHVLAWTTPAGCGNERFELKTGSRNSILSVSAPGYPTCDDIAINQTDGSLLLSNVWDGQWHTYRLHFAILGGGRFQVQSWIDGQMNADYVTTSGNPASQIRRVMLGSNRNLGAAQDMFLWWGEVKVWAR